MATYIRRKKHLNEAGDNVQQPAAAAQPAASAQPATPPQSQPAPAAPVQPEQPVQTQQPAEQQQQVQQPQQQTQQPQQDQKLVERNKNVTECLNGIRDVISKNDPYALIAFDVPAAMQAKVPDFTKDNPDAKATMEAWGKFKAAPSKETFDAMINEFSAFGNGGQQPAQQNTQEAQAQQAVNNQTAQESISRTFADKLNERLQHNSKFSHYEDVLTRYWTSPKL